MTAGDFKLSANLVGKTLASGQLATTAATTIFTVPASSAVKLATVSLTNISGSAIAVSVSVIPFGLTNDNTRVVLSVYPLAANDAISSDDVLSMLKGAMLETGAAISVTAATANAVNYLVTGAVSS